MTTKIGHTAMKPILFTKGNRAATRSGAKTQTRRVITDNMTSRIPYRVGEIRYVCEPYVIDACTPAYEVTGKYLDDRASFRITLSNAEAERWENRRHPWSPTQARFMYKSLARTFVEITGLRREPLQDITEDDAQAEGVDPLMVDSGGVTPWGWGIDVPDYGAAFAHLWDSINAKRGHGWDTNPTVLVIEYKLVTP